MKSALAGAATSAVCHVEAEQAHQPSLDTVVRVAGNIARIPVEARDGRLRHGAGAETQVDGSLFEVAADHPPSPPLMQVTIIQPGPPNHSKIQALTGSLPTLW